MSQNNKTAEQILDKWDVEYVSEELREYYSNNVIGAMEEYATQQTTLAVEEKDKLIEEISIENGNQRDELLMLKMSVQDKNDAYERLDNLRKWEFEEYKKQKAELQSSLTTQSKEIEELKEKNYVGLGMLKNALRDLDFMQKDRDEYRERYTCNQCTVVNQSARIKELEEFIKEVRSWDYCSESAKDTINTILSGQVDKEERKG